MKVALKYIKISFILLLLTACSKATKEKPEAIKEVVTVEIHSLDDLTTLFKQHNYTSEAWQQGERGIPRLTFAGVSGRWQHGSKNLPVVEKKRVFFKLMAPLVLMANEEILLERELIKSEPITSDKVRVLAQKYKVIDKAFNGQLTQAHKDKLLNRIDIMPPSLALAQAAEESGWATSRFTIEGNAFFGQWDFSGKGMIPKQQRKALGNYGLARFDSPLASVKGYMLNINTTNAYQKLRDKRANLRQNNEKIAGLALVGTLDKYSERGQAYIDSITNMITYNKLQDVDEAYLVGDTLIELKGE